MDHERFAALSRQVASASTRRGALRAAFAALGAGLLGRVGAGPAAAAPGEEAICRFPQEPCSKDRQCCAHKCKGGVCGCKKKGKPCVRNFGRSCCSGTCRRGKCK